MGSYELLERIEELSKKRKSPSHIRELRKALLEELEDWARLGHEINGLRLLEHVENYDESRRR